MSIVRVENRNFVAIGKMIFNSNSRWKIPHLHFMVQEAADGKFEAVNRTYSGSV
jgi:hypothetical protein